MAKDKEGVEYGKYDIGGVSAVAPKTPVKVVPGSYGRKKGGIATGLNRGKKYDAMFKEEKK